jgi:hypothetical protein
LIASSSQYLKGEKKIQVAKRKKCSTLKKQKNTLLSAVSASVPSAATVEQQSLGTLPVWRRGPSRQELNELNYPFPASVVRKFEALKQDLYSSTHASTLSFSTLFLLMFLLMLMFLFFYALVSLGVSSFVFLRLSSFLLVFFSRICPLFSSLCSYKQTTPALQSNNTHTHTHTLSSFT